MQTTSKERQFKTLLGMDLAEAIRRLDDPLPAKAYKEIFGGKGKKLGLTDIDPAYFPEKMTELFGPPGYGWGFNVVKSDYKDIQRIDKDGEAHDEYYGMALIEFWYRLVVIEDGHEAVIKCEGVMASGASQNDKLEWSLKGAITNALGTAGSFLGYQTSVYKGERGHKNPNGGQAPSGAGAEKQGKASPRAGSADKSPPKPNFEPVKLTALSPVIDAVKAIEQCKTIDELKTTWGAIYGTVQKTTEFWDAIQQADRDQLTIGKDNRKRELSK